MLQSCTIEPNMINAPWLDRPTRITESELTDLETNYYAMLDTIRNDTFGGIMPPKYDINQFTKNNENNNNENNTKTPYHVNNNGSIHIFNDNDNDESYLNESNPNLLSHLEFINNSNNSNNNNSNNNNNNNNDNRSNAINNINDDIDRLNTNYISSQEAFMSAEINLSVQRVRMQLNMTESPSLSPIPHSTNTSIIDINLNQISHSMNTTEHDDDDIDDNKNNLSLPFMSPSMDNNNNNTNNNDSNQSIFISESISPPIFTSSNNNRRSQSQQPLIHNPIPNINSAVFNSVPPPIPISHRNNNSNNNNNNNNLFDGAPTITLQQLNQTQSQILNVFGIPESVTSSMMLTPSNSAPPIHSNSFNRNHNQNSFNDDSFDDHFTSNFDINHAQQSLITYNINDNASNRMPPDAPQRRQRPSAPQRRNHRNRNRNNNRNNQRNNNRNYSSIQFQHDIHHLNQLNDIQEIHNIQHDMGSDHIESSSFGIDNASITPTNIQSRSHSVSLEAPRLQRRHTNRREDVSSLDLTQNNINI